MIAVQRNRERAERQEKAKTEAVENKIRKRGRRRKTVAETENHVGKMERGQR